MDEVTRRQVFPHLRDRDFADLSLAVYDVDAHVVGTWSRLSADELRGVGISPRNLEQPDCGFRAAIFSDGNEYVVAFAGTNEWKEIRTNLAQAFGFETKQYQAAVELGHQARKAFGGAVAFAGHSLGGGLATVAASVARGVAVTFNAAGVHSKTLDRAGLDPNEVRLRASSGSIRAYVVEGEILTKIQDGLPIPDAPGERICLADPDPPKGIRAVSRISRVVRSVQLHGMKSVVSSMEKDARFNRDDVAIGKSMLKEVGESLKKSGFSDASIGLVQGALARKISVETAAGRFTSGRESRDIEWSR